jgi:phenylacetate-coenzyme A ligase PaaK-like adenylate-forming protein
MLAYQERALRQLREHAYQKSRFYHDLMKVFLRRRCQHSLC